MRLAYADRACYSGARVRIMILPRLKGEPRSSYVARFMGAVRGLGHVHLLAVKGAKHRILASRDW